MYLTTLLLALLVTAILAAPAESATPAPDPAKALAQLRSQVEHLLAKPQPELFARHLRSILALSEEGFVRLSLNAPSHDEQAKEFVQYVTTISEGLKGDASRAESYLSEGKRTLVLARLSKIDGSLQYELLQLPKGWQPDKAYPMLVALHGSGPTNPLAYVSFCFLPETPKPASSQPPLPDMIVVTPWGRGNRGWVNDSETDLWEAVDEAKTICKFDPDHWYITGHSMGADGVWAIIQRTPDLWAAAGMQAGTMFTAPPEAGLLHNMAYVPLYIWIGADDTIPGRNDSAKAARDALTAIGNNVEFVESVGVGHSPRPEDGDAQLRWMVGHARVRPASFEFTIDTRNHRGVWGISVPYQGRRAFYYQAAPYPHFSCAIEGSAVHINTQNAPELLIDLGPSGLQMTGNVEVIVNGNSVYSGPLPSEPLDFKP